MITFARALFTCSVCGRNAEFLQAFGSAASGSPDIDLCPCDEEHGTISFAVQQCPNCGYANQTIEEKLPDEAVRAMLRSGRYANCDGILFRCDTAAKFYRYYLICRAVERGKEARNAITSAAWMCDDAGDRENAAACRRIAAELIHEQFIMEPSLALTVLWAEHMRRVEEFDRVLKETAGIGGRSENRMQSSLLTFERIHAKMRDSGRYTIAFALEEMRKREKLDPSPEGDRTAVRRFQ